jgi:hypothetical protein
VWSFRKYARAIVLYWIICCTSLKTKSIEEFAKVEVVTEPLRAAAAAAG